MKLTGFRTGEFEAEARGVGADLGATRTVLALCAVAGVLEGDAVCALSMEMPALMQTNARVSRFTLV